MFFLSRIILINHYASNPTMGMAGRHHYFARELAALDHDVTLVAARSHDLLQPESNVSHVPLVETIDGYRFIRISSVHYNNAHSKCRGIAWFVSTARVRTHKSA
jgi:hypothetical protein